MRYLIKRFMYFGLEVEWPHMVRFACRFLVYLLFMCILRIKRSVKVSRGYTNVLTARD